jgi:hypothetical protein
MLAQLHGNRPEDSSEPIRVEIVALPFWKLVGAIVVAQLIVGLLAFLFAAAFVAPWHVHHSSEQILIAPPPPPPAAPGTSR